MRASAASDQLAEVLRGEPVPAPPSGWRAWLPAGARARRLSLGALGLGLTLLFAVGWGSSLLYLLVQLDIPVRVSLVLTDAIHVWVGIVAIVFLSGKVWRVGHRTRVPGVPRLLLWQRWVSMALAVLCSGVLLSGLLLLLPVGGSLQSGLLEIHLLTAVWAFPLTVWHAWHYRRRALPHLPGPRRSRAAVASLAAALILLVPMAAAMAVPRALSQLSQIGAGDPWSQAGLDGKQVQQAVSVPGGRMLVRTPRGVFLGRPGGGWSAVPVVPGEQISTLSLTRTATGRVLVGTAYGLFAADRASGPYTSVYFPDGLAVDLTRDERTGVLWAAGSQGAATSDDGGVSWQNASRGLPAGVALSAVAMVDGTPYVAGPAAVYRWTWSDDSWVVSGHLADVRSLATAGRALYALAPGTGAWVLQGGAWQREGTLAALFAPRKGANQPSMAGMSGMSGSAMAGLPEGPGDVLADGGRLYAAGTSDRISASADGGRTWTADASGLPTGETVYTVVPLEGGRLLAATDDGVFVTAPSRVPPPGADWWAALFLLAAAAGVAGVVVGARWLRIPARSRTPRA